MKFSNIAIRTFCNTGRMMATKPASQPRLSVVPSQALVDDKIRMRVVQLQPHQPVTLAALLTEDNISFAAYSHYMADNNGAIDLHCDPSTGGTYTGTEPMGLFWSMKLVTGQKPGLRLLKKNVTTPLNTNIRLLAGHVDMDSVVEPRKVLAETSVKRYYMGPKINRIAVRTGRLRGVLFLPEGDGPFPGVVDLFGTAGGCIEFRAALLASRGFAAFALAYFGYEDLPSSISLDLEYFEEAIDWLCDHPKVLKHGIGTLGVSKGAELALHMAIVHPKILAAVGIGSFYYYATGEHRYKGKRITIGNPAMEKMIMSDEGLDFSQAYEDLGPDSDVPILELEKTKNAHYLLIAGEDDLMAQPRHAKILYQRLKEHGRGSIGKLLLYPGAGHLLEPPYAPLTRTSSHKIVGTDILFGGQAEAHAAAQEHSWAQILQFFTKRILLGDSLEKSQLGIHHGDASN